MKTYILATSNQRKVDELQQMLQHQAVKISPQNDFAIQSPAETGLTFVENALIKARHATLQAQLPAIADDSGIVVPSLNGEPGIFSARYAGENASDRDNIDQLLYRLSDHTDRRAYFYCVLVFLKHAHDPTPIICEGIWHGEILESIRGRRGFGYDPIFYVSNYQCSAAELDIATKNQLSHRGQALSCLQYYFSFHAGNNG